MKRFFSLFSQADEVDDGAPVGSVPAGLRIYTIGDIHGRLDLLVEMLGMIVQDATDAPNLDKHIIYLGDYVDRGLESRQVMDLLISDQPYGFEKTFLKGNHEDSMLQFMDGDNDGSMWFQFGGLSTMASYDVLMNEEGSRDQRLMQVREQLRENLPDDHLTFMRLLEMSISFGDYFFTHAGVRPGVALDAQSPQDLMWIRDRFLNSSVKHGKIVVHGHTISESPVVKSNRIGIDTGAYASGRLTCLVLEGDSFRFIQTNAEAM
ncbi:MAG: metallophosphoesterase family protein [Pseudomonadota bacterium]